MKWMTVQDFLKEADTCPKCKNPEELEILETNHEGDGVIQETIKCNLCGAEFWINFKAFDYGTK